MGVFLLFDAQIAAAILAPVVGHRQDCYGM